MKAFTHSGEIKDQLWKNNQKKIKTKENRFRGETMKSNTCINITSIQIKYEMWLVNK